jgi:hypothetical protein
MSLCQERYLQSYKTAQIAPNSYNYIFILALNTINQSTIFTLLNTIEINIICFNISQFQLLLLFVMTFENICGSERD